MSKLPPFPPTNFELPYYLSNQGDGSAALRLCKTMQEAIAADEAQGANGDGWSEDSADSIKFRVDDGKLYYREWGGLAGFVWVEVPQCKE
jgi:hypothetical protein